MVTVEPFNYYKDYLTVYAVHCISNESGISGERNGKFACHDSSGILQQTSVHLIMVHLGVHMEMILFLMDTMHGEFLLEELF